MKLRQKINRPVADAAEAKTRRAKPAAEAKAPTRKELAEALGVSVRTVGYWRQQGCPRNSLAAARKWVAENIAQPNPGQTTDEPLLALKRKKLHEEIEEKKFKNELRKSRHVLREDAEHAIAELCVHIKNRLESIPDEIEMDIPRAVRAAVTRAVANKIRLVLIEMSRWTI